MLILLTGLPGSGKSTVAKMLAEKTGGAIINSDALRKELFPEKRDYSSKETGIVIREKEKRVKEYLTQNKIVILDALFTKQNARDEYAKLAREMNVDFKVILVTAPEHLIEERLHFRTHTDNTSEATFAIYLDRKKHFELVKGSHEVINNDGSLEELYAKINLII